MPDRGATPTCGTMLAAYLADCPALASVGPCANIFNPYTATQKVTSFIACSQTGQILLQFQCIP